MALTASQTQFNRLSVVSVKKYYDFNTVRHEFGESPTQEVHFVKFVILNIVLYRRLINIFCIKSSPIYLDKNIYF